MRHPHFGLFRGRLAVEGRVLDEIGDVGEPGAEIGAWPHVGEVCEMQWAVDERIGRIVLLRSGDRRFGRILAGRFGRGRGYLTAAIQSKNPLTQIFIEL